MSDELSKQGNKELATRGRTALVGFVAGVLAVTLILPLVKAAILASLLPLAIVAVVVVGWKILK